jgi:hypothetical protein
MKRATYYSDTTVAKINLIANPELPNIVLESFSGRVGFLIDCADKIRQESVPALTLMEWIAVIQANKSTIITPELGAEFVVSGAWHNLFDSADEFDEALGVDCAALAKRLNNAPFAEQFAAFEVMRSFLLQIPNGDFPIAEVIERLTKLGAPGLMEHVPS